ncbi:MAG: gliding motility-associated C-terminal domain-containing protein [Flavobacteriales bacterium]
MSLRISLAIVFLSNCVFAQIDAGQDITICEIQAVNLSADYTPNSVGTNDYVLENVPYTTENYSGTLVNMFDDSEQGPFDIGFEFCFFGNIYSQFCLGSNGWITFDCGQPTTYVSGPIPNPVAPVNSIMGPWSDWNPGVGGQIRYETIGVAPNRALVVNWIDVPLYGGACGAYQGKFQIVLRETTNIIENNIEYKTNCPDEGAGGSDIAVQGIQNIDGSIAIVVPGRNATAWEATNESHQYIPSGLATSNVQWFDENNVLVGEGTDVTVNPLVTTTYTVTASECPDVYTDNITVFVSTPPSIQTVIDDNICPGEIYGSIEITPNGGVLPLSYLWTTTSGSFSANTEDIFNLNADSYSLTITDDLGCETDFGPFTISPPPLDIEIFESIDPVSCFGFSDGVISTTTSGGTPGYSYLWTGDNSITGNGTNTISDLAAGSYTVVVTDNNNCQDSSTFIVGQNSSITIISSESDYNGFNVKCYGNNDAWISCLATGGLLPYEFHWINDQTLDTISNQSDLYDLPAGNYSLYVIDAEGCPNSLSFDITQPDSISIDISDYSHKSCTYNNDGFIEVASWGGPDNPAFSENYLPFTFEWKGQNSFYSENENIYNLSEGVYTITVKDVNDCTNSLDFEITQPPFVIADYRVLNDTVTTNYPFTNIYDISEGNIVEWQWEISNGFSSSSQNIYDLDLSTNLDSSGVKYFDLKLVVTDEFMCKDSVYGTLAIKDEHTLFVPNGFTPDMDGNNDTFKVFYHGMKTETFSIIIYDRFGSIVFKSNNPNVEWDGTNMFTSNPLITGAYTYVLSYQDFESKIYDHTNCENCSGTITLVR